MIQAEIPSAQKINLYDKLHLEDYYRTDLHWKQEKITGVVDALVQSMGQQTIQYLTAGRLPQRILSELTGQPLHGKPHRIQFFTGQICP